MSEPSEPTTRMIQTGAEWLTTRTGGLNRYADGLARALSAEGVSQRWLVVADRNETPAAGVEVTAVARPGDSLLTRWRAMRVAFDRTVAELDSAGGNPRAVVASHFALYAFPLRRRLRGRPHVVHFHGPWAAEGAREGAGGLSVAFKRWIERRVYRTAGRVVCLSQAFADVVTRDYGVDRARVRIVPGGVDAAALDAPEDRAEARRVLGWPTDRPVVLSVRRLVPRMGLDRLIDAVAMVRAAHPEVLVLIAGRGSQRALLQQRIAEQGLEDHVRLLGYVSDAQLPLAYRAADVSVVPTRALEGFGLVCLESLAAGTPVLVTPVGGLPEVVRGLAPGLVMASGEPGVMAEALGDALSGRVKLPDAEACRRYVRERFDWSVIAPQVLGVYREAAGVRGS